MFAGLLGILASVHGFDRQLDREGRAALGFAPDPEAPAVALDDVVADVEPEPRAFLLGGEERIEEPRLLLGWNAVAVVHHAGGDQRGARGIRIGFGLGERA